MKETGCVRTGVLQTQQ